MTIPTGVQIVVRTQLETAGTELNRRAQELQDELVSLKGTIETLTELWVGATREDYTQFQNEWNIGAEGLFGADGVLGRIAHAMNITWQNYAEGETINAATWANRR